MPEIEHHQPPTAPAPVDPPQLRLAPRGLARATLAPIGALALAVATVAAARHQWHHLLGVAAVAPVAVLLHWALTVHADGRRGVGIHPAARTAALAVIGLGIVAGLVVCTLAVVAPQMLGLTAGSER